MKWHQNASTPQHNYFNLQIQLNTNTPYSCIFLSCTGTMLEV